MQRGSCHCACSAKPPNTRAHLWHAPCHVRNAWSTRRLAALQGGTRTAAPDVELLAQDRVRRLDAAVCRVGALELGLDALQWLGTSSAQQHL